MLQQVIYGRLCLLLRHFDVPRVDRIGMRPAAPLQVGHLFSLSLSLSLSLSFFFPSSISPVFFLCVFGRFSFGAYCCTFPTVPFWGFGRCCYRRVTGLFGFIVTSTNTQLNPVKPSSTLPNRSRSLHNAVQLGKRRGKPEKT